MSEDYVPLTGNAASRTRQYVDRRSKERASENHLAVLEERLEDEERRNVRLSNQLIDEVALRARAERVGDDLRTQLQSVKTELEAVKTELKAATDGTVKKAPKVKKETVKPVEEPPEPKPKKPKPTSSRTRGNVK